MGSWPIHIGAINFDIATSRPHGLLVGAEGCLRRGVAKAEVLLTFPAAGDILLPTELLGLAQSLAEEKKHPELCIGPPRVTAVGSKPFGRGCPSVGITVSVDISQGSSIESVLRPTALIVLQQLWLQQQSESAALPRSFSLISAFSRVSLLQGVRGPPLSRLRDPCVNDSTSAAQRHARLVQVLTPEVLAHILTFLPPADFASAANTCFALKEISVGVVHGLRTSPYDHQRQCLRWMMVRELGCGVMRNPLWAKFGDRLHVDLFTGAVAETEEEVPSVVDIRGGMVCDDPGLGKTLEGIMVVLSSIGVMAKSRNEPLLAAGQASGQDSSCRRSQRVAGIIHAERTSKLINSSTTLIIAPAILVTHWHNQFKLHCSPGAMPKIYVQRERKRLPPAEMLVQYDVVIMSRERLGHLYHKGRSLETAQIYGYWKTDCELLRVLWLRLIVDEGHHLGGNAMQGAVILATSIQAERRWVFTGTPAKNAETDDLQGLRRLLQFLSVQPYGCQDPALWNRMVARPFREQRPEAFLRVTQLLTSIMIRADKSLLKKGTTARVIRQDVELHLSSQEVDDYNSLACVALQNIHLTSLEGGTHGMGASHPDSWLHPDNTGKADEILLCLRLACIGGGRTTLSVDVEATQSECQALGADKANLSRVQMFLESLNAGCATPCDLCGMRLRLLAITPCMHLLCCECFKDITHECRVCRQYVDTDSFQALQPRVNWLYQYSEEEEQHKSGAKIRHLLQWLEGALKEERDARDRALLSSVETAPPRSLKVIIYSGLPSALDLLDWVLQPYGENFFVRLTSKKGAQEVIQKFTYDDDVKILLLGREGSTGLDLQFASHVIMMERLWDASLEKQVVGRADRIGASGPVVVQRLTVADTLEATINEKVTMREKATRLSGGVDADDTWVSAANAGSSSSQCVAQVQADGESPSKKRRRSGNFVRQARTAFLLSSLKLIRREPCTDDAAAAAGKASCAHAAASLSSSAGKSQSAIGTVGAGASL